MTEPNPSTPATNLTANMQELAKSSLGQEKEQWGNLSSAFTDLTTNFNTHKSVRRLFTIEDSDKLHVKDLHEALEQALPKGTDSASANTNGNTNDPDDAKKAAAVLGAKLIPLRLEFTKAGVPIGPEFTISRDSSLNDNRYEIKLSDPEATYSLKLRSDPQLGDQLQVYADTDDPAATIQYRIDQIDAIISAQLSAIMHDPAFQKLEASWRGLHQLVFNTETGAGLKLRLLNARREELQADLDNAVEFDQSALFKKVYEAEYGMFGGSPYSALLADYEFGRDPKELSLLTKLSNVAAAAHAPIITAAAPALFSMERFSDLDKPRDLATVFDSALHIAWRAFRDSEDSRYVALTLPHVLMRLPYGPHTNPVDEFNFVEDVAGTEQDNPRKFLWGNAAWALAQRITGAFSLYGWTAAIRGYEGGGLVTDLPIYTFKTDDGRIAVRVPTEVAITDRREKELSDLGFIALCYRKETDQAAFFGGQTANKPKVYIEDSATANARLSSQLPYMLACSRFAHYIKVLMRDRIGSFMSQAEVARLLNRWISQYVLLDDLASQPLKARYPLREARIDVTANPAKPGSYKAVVFLRPHFQLEELTVSIRLVAELPPPAAA